jgi:hypothetical protein
VPLREVTAVKEQSCTDNRGFSLFRDRIAVEEMDVSQLDQKIVHCLWHDSNSIRLIKRKKYNEQEILLETNDTLQELQVKYLLGDITETHWSRQVYQQSNKKTLSLLYGDVLNIYLSTVDIFQQMLTLPLTHAPRSAQEHYQPNIGQQQHIHEQYEKLVLLCNESLNSIQEEYGGSPHHIRMPSEDASVPSFT